MRKALSEWVCLDPYKPSEEHHHWMIFHVCDCFPWTKAIASGIGRRKCTTAILFFFFLSHGTCAEAAAVPVSAQEWMWLHEEMLGGALLAVLHIILCQLNQDSQKFGRSLCWRILFGSKPLWATIPNPLHGVTEYTQSSEHLQVWMELSESTTAVSLGDQQLTDNYASIRNHAMKQ